MNPTDRQMPDRATEASIELAIWDQAVHDQRAQLVYHAVWLLAGLTVKRALFPLYRDVDATIDSLEAL